MRLLLRISWTYPSASTFLKLSSGSKLSKKARARGGVLIDSLFEGLADEFGHADACTSRLQFETLVQIILLIQPCAALKGQGKGRS